MNTSWVITVIVVCALVTFFERAFPFLIFRGKQVPDPVRYLGTVLPMAIITTLIFYCLRSVDFHSVSAWAPQILSGGLTVVLHLWKRSTLLSIAGGTICCMLLTQIVF